MAIWILQGFCNSLNCLSLEQKQCFTSFCGNRVHLVPFKVLIVLKRVQQSFINHFLVMDLLNQLPTVPSALTWSPGVTVCGEIRHASIAQ